MATKTKDTRVKECLAKCKRNGDVIIIYKDNLDDGMINRIYAYARKYNEKVSVVSKSTREKQKMEAKLLSCKNLSPKKIMEKTGWNYQKAYKFLKANGVEWKRPPLKRNISKATIIRLHQKGKSGNTIAKSVGCSRQYVSLVLKDDHSKGEEQ